MQEEKPKPTPDVQVPQVLTDIENRIKRARRYPVKAEKKGENQPDPFIILNVDRSAIEDSTNSKEIKKRILRSAHIKLVKDFHLDSRENKDQSFNKRFDAAFQAIETAYQTLRGVIEGTDTIVSIPNEKVTNSQQPPSYTWETVWTGNVGRGGSTEFVYGTGKRVFTEAQKSAERAAERANSLNEIKDMSDGFLNAKVTTIEVMNAFLISMGAFLNDKEAKKRNGILSDDDIMEFKILLSSTQILKKVNSGLDTIIDSSIEASTLVASDCSTKIKEGIYNCVSNLDIISKAWELTLITENDNGKKRDIERWNKLYAKVYAKLAVYANQAYKTYINSLIPDLQAVPFAAFSREKKNLLVAIELINNTIVNPVMDRFPLKVRNSIEQEMIRNWFAFISRVFENKTNGNDFSYEPNLSEKQRETLLEYLDNLPSFITFSLIYVNGTSTVESELKRMKQALKKSN